MSAGAHDAEWGALGEDEELLFEGGARGRPPLGRVLPVYVLVLLLPYLLGGLMLLLGWLHAPVAPTWDVGARVIRMRWEHEMTTAVTSAPGPLWGPIDIDLPWLVAPVEVPWAIVVLVGLAVLELIRLARWRSHRVAVTNRRVLLAHGVVRRRCAVHARTGGEALQRVSPVEDRLADLEGGAALVVPGLDDSDRQALQRALARFEPGRTPAPPDPTVRRRALLALVLVGLLGLVAALWVAAAPGRVTLAASRAGAPGERLLEVAIDSPTWSALRVVPWSDGAPRGRLGSGTGEARLQANEVVGALLEPAPVTLDRVELDGQPWRPRSFNAWVTARWEGGLLRTRLSFTLKEAGALIAAERVVVAGRLRTVEGLELPFEVSLPAPGKVTLRLAPRAP